MFFSRAMFSISILLAVSMHSICSQAETLKERVTWYRAILWPMEIEKEYATNQEACHDMLLEQILADRFQDEFEIDPELRARIRRTDHFYCYMTLVKSEIISPARPSQSEIQVYYNAHPEEFLQPEKVQVQMVFIEFGPNPTSAKRQEVKQQAWEAHQRATLDADFTELVKQYSSVKKNRGIIGPFPRNIYNPVLTECAFTLEPGEISEPFATEQGYFILKSILRIPSGTSPLEDIELQVKAKVDRENRERLRADLFEKAMQKFQVKVFEDRYTLSNHSTNIDQPVIEGLDFSYTKRDLSELFPDYRPQDNPNSTRDFQAIIEMLALDQLFQHSPEAQSSHSLAQRGFVESYHLSQEYLKRMVAQQTFNENECRAYYEKHSSWFLTPIERELSLIRIRVDASPQASRGERHYAKLRAKQKIEEAQERLKKGENFSEIAKAYSDDSSSAKGGYLGWVREPSSALIDTTAAELEPGQVSDIKEKSDSFFMIQLHSVKEQIPLPYEQVKDRIDRLLREDYSDQLRMEIEEQIKPRCAELDCANF